MKVLLLFAVFFCFVQGNSGDIPPGIRNTVCLMQQGHCRLFMCRNVSYILRNRVSRNQARL
ncbi:sperm associated antigen 11, isoform CRA_b [Mus musculus]|nr:sperm associated antigen 11, isoform CRA_b [Mus musculus]